MYGGSQSAHEEKPEVESKCLEVQQELRLQVAELKTMLEDMKTWKFKERLDEIAAETKAAKTNCESFAQKVANECSTQAKQTRDGIDAVKKSEKAIEDKLKKANEEAIKGVKSAADQCSAELSKMEKKVGEFVLEEATIHANIALLGTQLGQVPSVDSIVKKLLTSPEFTAALNKETNAVERENAQFAANNNIGDEVRALAGELASLNAVLTKLCSANGSITQKSNEVRSLEYEIRRLEALITPQQPPKSSGRKHPEPPSESLAPSTTTCGESSIDEQKSKPPMAKHHVPSPTTTITITTTTTEPSASGGKVNRCDSITDEGEQPRPTQNDMPNSAIVSDYTEKKKVNLAETNQFSAFKQTVDSQETTSRVNSLKRSKPPRDHYSWI